MPVEYDIVAGRKDAGQSVAVRTKEKAAVKIP